MSLEIGGRTVLCYRCGAEYSKYKGLFPVSYANLHKGVGYLPWCKKCVEDLYNTYLAQSNDAKAAARQVCRKLDLFWSDAVYDRLEKTASPASIMTQYMSRLCSTSLAGKSYDDTLAAEGTLWSFTVPDVPLEESEPETEVEEEPEIEVPEEIRQFWGPGYDSAMYLEMEERRQYWLSRMSGTGELDIGTEALIRQICPLEIDINRERAAGHLSEAGKLAGNLNNLLGSMNLKPVQQKDDVDADLEKTPLGVGIAKWEYYRPLPQTPDNMKDQSGLVKTVLTFFTGHLCKMAGVKGFHSRMYDEAMERLRVKRPDIDEEDDREFQAKFFDSGDDPK